mmetsp:Transcript_9263/g.37924  ORF Transcript_9263/g.37924 Transcript_9263/m.37924 type:complete len:250 (-) Transcript_9263:548-1297(-)
MRAYVSGLLDCLADSHDSCLSSCGPELMLVVSAAVAATADDESPQAAEANAGSAAAPRIACAYVLPANAAPQRTKSNVSKPTKDAPYCRALGTQRCPVAKKKRAHARCHSSTARIIDASGAAPPSHAARAYHNRHASAPSKNSIGALAVRPSRSSKRGPTMSAPKDALPTPLTPARRSTPAHASTTSGAARARRGNAVRSIACTAAAVPSFAPAAESQDASAPLAFKSSSPHVMIVNAKHSRTTWNQSS